MEGQTLYPIMAAAEKCKGSVYVDATICDKETTISKIDFEEEVAKILKYYYF